MLDEIYYCVKELGFSYSDLMNIPVFERRYFIDKFVSDMEKIKEEQRKSK